VEITATLGCVYRTPVFFCNCGIEVGICTPISLDALTKQSLRIWLQDGNGQLRVGVWRHSRVNTNGKLLQKAGDSFGNVLRIWDGETVYSATQSDLNRYSFKALLNSDNGGRAEANIVCKKMVRKGAVLSDLSRQLRTRIRGKAKGVHHVNLQNDQDNAVR